VKWSPAGSLLAAADADRKQTLIFRQDALETPIAAFDGHTDTINSVDWSKSGHSLVTAGDDMQIVVRDTEKGSVTYKFNAPVCATDAKFSLCGQRLLCCILYQHALMMDLRIAPGRPQRLPVYAAAAAWSPSGQEYALSSKSGQMHLFNAENGASLNQWEVIGYCSYGCGWSPDGRLFAHTASSWLSVWDGTNHRSYKTCEPSSDLAISMAWSPDSTRLAVGHNQGQVSLVVPGTIGMFPADVLPLQGTHATTVSWSLTGDLLATNSGVVDVSRWTRWMERARTALRGEPFHAKFVSNQ